MPKKTLVEISSFAKLLSFFYKSKEKGKDDALGKAVEKTQNKELERTYKAWRNSADDMLDATRALLRKTGFTEKQIEDIFNKYQQ